MSESEIIEIEVAGEETRNLPAVRAGEAIMARAELSVAEVVAQKDKIVAVMNAVMKADVHYGTIPGTNKPTLYKPGAEAINVALRLAPHYQSDKVFHDDGHLTVSVVCELRHIPTDLVIATGEGLCTSREKKYAERKQKRVCPSCGAPAIIKGKAEFGGGWVCWKKADVPGCGAKYADGDSVIEDQAEGTIVNPDLADTWNTVLKMADKRALIAAVLNGTAASDVFTQDMEDSRGSGSADELPRDEDPKASPSEPAVSVPKSWPEIEKAIRAADNPEEAWALWEAFLRAVTYHLYGKTSLKDVTTAQRKVMLQKASGAAVWLHENVAYDGPFLLFDEAEQRRAWAAVLDGTDLQIPDYVPPAADEHETLDEEAARIADETIIGPPEAE